MSTLKSSSADLTLNADGSGNDILFQSNASQVGSLTAEGVLTAATITASTAFVPDASGGADLGTTSLEFNDLFLNTSGAIQFGDSQDVTLTHDANLGGSGRGGLALKTTGTSDGTYPVFELQIGETAVEDNDYLGVISWRAPDEAGGTDATTVAAAILARAEADFTSSVNKTKLVFQTGSSGAADDALSILNDGRGLSPFTCRAWARFSASALNNSHNCSSFTDNGTGDYTIAFTNSMPTANYAFSLTGHRGYNMGAGGPGTPPATGSLRMNHDDMADNPADGDWMSMIIFVTGT
jgi:hypothetical protein